MPSLNNCSSSPSYIVKVPILPQNDSKIDSYLVHTLCQSSLFNVLKKLIKEIYIHPLCPHI